MKKFSLSLLALAMALPAHADFIGAKVGADVWTLDAKVADQDAGKDTTGSFYVSVEHFIPLIPNARIRQTNVDTSGVAFDQTDYTLYYELLDNSLIAFDVGVNFAQFRNGQVGAQRFDGEWQPSLYGNVEIGIPATNVTLFTDLNFSSFNKNSTVDGQAGIKYTFNMVAFDINARAGYRAMDYDFDFVSGNQGEIFTHGAFAGIEFDF